MLKAASSERDVAAAGLHRAGAVKLSKDGEFLPRGDDAPLPTPGRINRRQSSAGKFRL
jgi:hypothetical protein